MIVEELRVPFTMDEATNLYAVLDQLGGMVTLSPKTRSAKSKLLAAIIMTQVIPPNPFTRG